ncbi:S24 family peptidase [Deinococcus misasensis]|uniref:S24 family peptidase n=1 Tax=Deinococcus misasensis TaxID=392413 RepID=UPI001FDFEADC|nr:S24 family peptidase [Deinococcus misasensis]
MSEESRARFESKRLVIESLTSPKENPTRGNAIPASDVSLHHVYPLKVADQPKEGLELPYPIILTPAQHRPRMLVLQMAGDEMRSLADNSIRNDDIFLVDLDEQTPTPDSIFVLKSGKNVYVRRCVKTATGDFWMVADNNSPEHLPIPIKDARVIGRAYLLLPNKPL